MLELRPIPGYPNYLVRSDGVILGRWGRPMSSKKMAPTGYPVLTLRANGKKRCKPIHYWVAMAWLPARPSPDHEVAHNDGVKTNNAPDNLRWATHFQNCQDSRRHKSMSHGEMHTFAKLTDAAVLEIRRRSAGGERSASLAECFGVRQAAITRAVRRVTWSHLP